jgi:hypothetical protein
MKSRQGFSIPTLLTMTERSGSQRLAGTAARRTIKVLLVVAAMFLFSLLIVELEVWAGIDGTFNGESLWEQGGE